MKSGGNKRPVVPQSGYEQFQAQRQRLRAHVDGRRVSESAGRFNALSETQKKVIIMLANDAAAVTGNLPQLTRSHLDTPFEQFTNDEQATALLGIKKLSELSAAIPWCWPDSAALSSERLAVREVQPIEQKQQPTTGGEPVISTPSE